MWHCQGVYSIPVQPIRGSVQLYILRLNLRTIYNIDNISNVFFVAANISNMCWHCYIIFHSVFWIYIPFQLDGLWWEKGGPGLTGNSVLCLSQSGWFCPPHHPPPGRAWRPLYFIRPQIKGSRALLMHLESRSQKLETVMNIMKMIRWWWWWLSWWRRGEYLSKKFVYLPFGVFWNCLASLNRKS